MIGPELQTIAQLAVERMLNTLPQQLLVVAFAWVLAKLLGRRSSRTRFAVWLLALVAVVGVALVGGSGGGQPLVGSGSRAPITIPGQWAMVVFGAWTIVAGAAITRLLAGLWRLRALRRSCVAIDAVALDPAVKRTIAEFSATRAVAITTSESVRVPAAIGFLKPMIVIPRWVLNELSAEELKIILVHEHAHLRNRDDWTNLLQKFVRALFIFHPAVWWIEKRLSLEREMACDDAVLAETGNPRSYAQCLIGMLERSCPRRAWAMAHAVVHRAQEASLRLARILDRNRPSATQAWKPALGLMGVFAAVAFAAAPLSPKLVTFGPSAERVEMAQAAVSDFSDVPKAAIVPVALRSSESAPGKAIHLKAKTGDAKGVLSHHPEAGAALASVHPRDANPAPELRPVNLDESVAQSSQTLVFVQAIEYVDPNSNTAVWSVRVVRILLANPPQNRAPVAKST